MPGFLSSPAVLVPILARAGGIMIVRLFLGPPDPPLRPRDTEGMATDPRQELAEFLKTRRTRVRPEDLGLEPGPRRRVAGLRREELALLAGVSTDYYQRMEQGRDVRPSDQVLDAIATALRFTPEESRHLHNLAAAARTPARPPRYGPEA